MAACGGRTSLPTSGEPFGGDDAAALSNAFKVTYAVHSYGFTTWHSNGAETVDKTSLVAGISCTYDGRFTAFGRFAMPPTFEVRDSTGAVVRVQEGDIEALRPDGARAIVGRPTDDHDYCMGTLDADDTFVEIGCFDRNNVTTSLVAAAYAPNGTSVLWERVVYDPVTTSTLVAFEIGREDSTDRHEVAPLTPVGHFYSSPAFSFDGTRIVYVDTEKNYDVAYSDVDVVDLATFTTTKVLANVPWVLDAAFTPDGTSLVILQSSTEDMGSESDAIRRIDLSTHEESTLFEETQGQLIRSAFCLARDD